MNALLVVAADHGWAVTVGHTLCDLDVRYLSCGTHEIVTHWYHGTLYAARLYRVRPAFEAVAETHDRGVVVGWAAALAAQAAVA